MQALCVYEMERKREDGQAGCFAKETFLLTPQFPELHIHTPQIPSSANSFNLRTQITSIQLCL